MSAARRLYPAGASTGSNPGLPAVIEAESRASDIVDCARANAALIGELLATHGGVLFRNFRVSGAAHFDRFARDGFAADLMSYDNRSTPRTAVRGNVYTSTEYPASQTIPLHNENSYTRSWARKIFFYCVKPSASGGETPIADSRRVLRRIPEEIVERFDRHGLIYERNYCGLDLSWQEVFQTEDRAEVGRYCSANAIEHEWVDDDHLRTRQHCQALIRHPETGELAWFNQAHLFHVSALEPRVRAALLESVPYENLPRNVRHGDGSPIDPADLDAVRRAYDEEEVVFPWKAGDILLLDNMLTAHGRRPFDGSRKVLVAMSGPFSNDRVAGISAS